MEENFVSKKYMEENQRKEWTDSDKNGVGTNQNLNEYNSFKNKIIF